MTNTVRRKAAAWTITAALTGFAALTGALAGSGAAQGAPRAVNLAATTAAGGKVTFTVGVLEDFDSLNPFTGINAVDYTVWGEMYDSLTGYAAKDFAVAPALATSWTTSPDGLTWTYQLRPGVTWSDGTPLTSADAVYTINRIRKGSYESTNWGNYVRLIVDAKAPDANTLVLTTSKPAPILAHLALPILPEHIWSGISAKEVKKYSGDPTATAPIVGSGPFILTERKTGQYVRLVANKNYWGGAPHIDELVYRVYRNPDSLAQALKQGEVDFVDNLDADVWQSLKGAPGVTAYAARQAAFDELAFNTGAALVDGTAIGDGSPAVKDAAFRRAVSWAIDRGTLVQRLLNGNGSAGTTVIPPLYEADHLTPATEYGYDPAKAETLLDAAGYTKGADGLRTLPGGKPMNLRLLARQESQPSQQSIRLISSWFAKIGIKTSVKVVSEDALIQIVAEGRYDMFEWGWAVEPDPDYQLSVMVCAQRSTKDGSTIYSGLSDSFYCNPAYDKLYALQATQIDPAARAATVKQMQQILYDDQPYALLYYYDDLQAYSTKFGGFVPQPADRGLLWFQYGNFSPLSVDLASNIAAAATPTGAVTTSTGAGPSSVPSTSGSGGAPIGWIIAGVLAALALGAAGFIFGRKRGTDADVE